MIDRLVYIGQNVEISSTFLDEYGNVIVPSDPNYYPNYVVKDVDGDVVSFGVGTINNVTKSYEASITIPTRAKVSTPDVKWSIRWSLVDVANKEYFQTELFDVALPNYEDTEFKEQKKLTLCTLPIVLTCPILSEPDSIIFELYDESDAVVLSLTPTLEGIYNDLYIYNVTIPANTTTARKIYGAIWTFEINGLSHSSFAMLYSVSLYELGLISDLRLFIDKSLKPLDVYLGYHDSDLYFGLVNGINYLNLIPPTITQWTLDNVLENNMLRTPLIWAAASVVLNMQYLAEADAAFDYSGQAISLTVDHTSYIESKMERLRSYLDDQFAKQKSQMVNANMPGTGNLNAFHLGTSIPTVPRRFSTGGIPAILANRAPWLFRSVFRS